VTLSQLLIATVVVAVGASIQGVMGFGLGLIGAPILALLDPDLVPGPLLFAVLPLTVLVARRERGALDFHGVRWALVGRLPGTIVGSLAIAALPEGPLAVMLGGLVLVAVAISLAGWHVRPTTGTLLTAGAVSGFMGTATSIGGPPMALLYQRQSGPELRATLAAYFVVGGVISLTVLSLAGEFAGAELRAGVILLPGVLAGFAGSAALGRFIDRGHTRTAVLGFSAAASIALIVQQLV
jgi:uncharacterized membrane protein YfcA